MSGEAQSGVDRKIPSRRKKRKTAVQPTHIGYVMKVTGYAFHYGLSPGNERWTDGAYSEINHLMVEGSLLGRTDSKHPSRIVLTIMGKNGMLEEAKNGECRIGGMAVRPEYIDAFIQVPSERISLLAQYLGGAGVRCNLTAGRIRWRTAHIWSFSITNEPVDVDDL
jgi:hypothetical protein